MYGSGAVSTIHTVTEDNHTHINLRMDNICSAAWAANLRKIPKVRESVQT